MSADNNNILATLLEPLLLVAGDRVAFADGQERLEYWSAFQQLYEIFPYKDVKYGEIYNRYMIGNILFILARAKVGGSGEEGDGTDAKIPAAATDDAFEGFPSSPVSVWNEDDWDMFAGYLTAIADHMKRKDADAAVPSDPEDAELDEQRGVHDLFTVKVHKLLRHIKVHKAVCPLWAKLTEQIDNEHMEDKEYPKIPKKAVEKLWKTALAEEDEAVRDQIVRKLFEAKEERKEDKKASTTVATASPPSLRTIGELRTVLQQKPFTFEKFDERVELLLVEWVETVFDEPKLLPFYFPDGVGEQSAEALMRLREARYVLRQEGLDPLEESIRLANTLGAGHSASPHRTRRSSRTAPVATAPGSHSRRRGGGGGSGMYKRKQTATRLEFEDDDEEEVSSEDNKGGDGTYRLSRLPRREALPARDEEDKENTPRKKARKSQEKKYEGKRPWTDEEKKAIIQGIHSFGLGKWAQIKAKYDVLFYERCSAQIKDCFRTMRRRGEIPKELLPDEE